MKLLFPPPASLLKQGRAFYRPDFSGQVGNENNFFPCAFAVNSEGAHFTDWRQKVKRASQLILYECNSCELALADLRDHNAPGLQPQPFVGELFAIKAHSSLFDHA